MIIQPIPLSEVQVGRLVSGLTEVDDGDADRSLKPFELDRVRVTLARDVPKVFRPGEGGFANGTTPVHLADCAVDSGLRPLSLRAVLSIAKTIPTGEFIRRFGSEGLLVLGSGVNNSSPTTRRRVECAAVATIIPSSSEIDHRGHLTVFTEGRDYRWAFFEFSTLCVCLDWGFIHWAPRKRRK